MDNIKVAIRVRPMISRENGMEHYWTVQNNTLSVTAGAGKTGSSYTFDRIFDEQMTTYDVFLEICRPIIDSAVLGFNGTIFAYGQSSSGKTFTMSGTCMQKGIISLAVDEIFEKIETSCDREFLIRVAYMEIYNEKVTDLLSTEEKTIRIQEDQEKNIQVTGVKEELVGNSTDVLNIIQRGDNRRHMAETKQNDRSSRSHCIVRMIIESRTKDDEEAVRVAHLNFVDLAGSEKAGENSGDRLREGCSINKSLLTLGQVICKLSDGVSNQHISYRDSKLTRILQISLGGNSKTAIIATITPASLDESHSTLRFASQAKKIKNQATVNEVLSDAAMLKKYQKEIRLQQQLNERGKLENEDLQKRLEEKEAEINHLKKFVIKSGPVAGPVKRKRRETWCPGKVKRMGRMSVAFQSTVPSTDLEEIPEIPGLIEDLFEAPAEEVCTTLPNITTRKKSIEYNKSFDRRSTVSFSPDPTTCELIEIQNKYEDLMKENKRLETEHSDMLTFHQLERECLENNIKVLENNIRVLEEENEAIKLTSEQSKEDSERSGDEIKDMASGLNSSCENTEALKEKYEQQIADLQTYCTTLSVELEEQRRMNENYGESVLTTHEEELGKLKSLCESMSSEITTLKSVNEELTCRNEELVLSSRASVQVEEELQERIVKIEAEYEEKISNIVAESVNKERSESSVKPGHDEQLEELLERKEFEIMDSEDKREALQMEFNQLKQEMEETKLQMTGMVNPENLHAEFRNIIEVMKREHGEEMAILKKQYSVESSMNGECDIVQTDTWMKDNQDIQKEYERLKLKIDTLTQEKEQLQEQLQNSGENVVQVKLQEQCEHLRVELDALCEENQKLTEELKNSVSESERDALQEECKVLRTEIQNVEDEKQQLVEEISSTRDLNMEKMICLEEECERLKVEVQTQAVTSQELADECHCLRMQVQNAEKENKTNVDQLPLNENSNSLWQEECEKLQREIEELKSSKLQDLERETGVEKLELLKDENDRLKQELDAAKHSVCAPVNVDAEDAESNGSSGHLKSDILQETIEQPQEEQQHMDCRESEMLQSDVLETFQKECEVLRKKIVELENAESEKSEVFKEKSILTESLQEENKRLNAKLQALELERQQLDNAREEFSPCKSPPNETEIDKLQQECFLLREKVKKLEDIDQPGKIIPENAEDMQVVQEECANLKLELEKLQTQHIELLEKAAADSSRAAVVEEECEVLQATIKELADKPLSMQEDEQAEASHKEEELISLQQRYESLTQDNEVLQLEITQLKEEIAVQTVEAINTTDLKQLTENLHHQVAKLENEKLELITSAETAEFQFQENTVALEQECKEFKERINVLEEENCSLLNKIQLMEGELEERKHQECSEGEHIGALQAEIEQLKMTVTESKEEQTVIEVKLQKTISELQVRASMYEETTREFQSEAAQNEEEKSQLRQELETVKQERNRYYSPESVQSEIENQIMRVTAQYKQELQEKTSVIDTLQEELRKSEDSSCLLETKLLDLKNNYDEELIKQRMKLEGRLSQLEEEIMSSEEQHRQFVENMEAFQESKISALQQEIKNVADEAHRTTLSTKEECDREIQNIHAQYQKEKEDYIKTIEILRSQTQELSGDSKRRNDQEEVIRGKEEEISRLSSEVTKLSEEVEVLSSTPTWMKFHDMNKDLSGSWAEEKLNILNKIDIFEKMERRKRTYLSREISSLKEIRDEVLSDNETLQEQLKELENKNMDCELSQKLKDAEKNADKYYDLYNEEERKSEMLVDQLSKEKTLSNAIEKKYDELKARLSKQENDNAALKKKSYEIHKLLEDTKRELGDKNLEIYSQKQTITSWQSQQDKRVKQYEESLEMYENRIKKLQGELRRRDADTTYSGFSNSDKESEDKNVGSGGVVSHFTTLLLEAENKRLKKENAKLKTSVQEGKSKPCSCPSVEDIRLKYDKEREEKIRLQSKLAEMMSEKENISKSDSVLGVKIPGPEVPITKAFDSNNQCKQQ